MTRRTTFIPFCHIAVADEIALTSNLDALELGCLHKIRNYLWIHNFIGLKNDDRQLINASNKFKVLSHRQ